MFLTGELNCAEGMTFTVTFTSLLFEVFLENSSIFSSGTRQRLQGLRKLRLRRDLADRLDLEFRTLIVSPQSVVIRKNLLDVSQFFTV